MKLLIDMNLSPRWVPWLGDHGHVAQHWSAIGAVDAPDAKIMDHALASGAVVLTNDLDFGALLASSGNAGPSVILIRAGTLAPERIGAGVLRCLSDFQTDLITGAIVVLDDRRHKVRLLPIRSGR
ncbi:MAG: DUF5615 family PIN-like protein [Panacagrimonas sp.]